MVLIGTNTSVIAGLVERLGIEQEVPLPKESATVIAKGQVIAPDSDGFYTATAIDGSSTGPFAVAVKAAGSGTTSVYAVTVGSIVSVVADGAIKPRKYVMPSGTTAGQVIQWTPPSGSVTTNSDMPDLVLEDQRVGIYLKQAKHVPQGDGVNLPVDAADGDIILILLV